MSELITEETVAIYMIRRWVEGQILKQAELLKLPKNHLGFELVAQGIAMATPGVNVDQARQLLGGFINQVIAGLETAPASTPDSKVVSMHPVDAGKLKES